jgi:hypothetical protein
LSIFFSLFSLLFIHMFYIISLFNMEESQVE